MWSVKCEVWGLECEGSSEKWEVWTADCEVWSVECEVWSVECEVWSLECEECSVKCGVWSVKTLLRLSLKKKPLVEGRTRSGQVFLRTIGHLFLGNFRRRLARVLVVLLTMMINEYLYDSMYTYTSKCIYIYTNVIYITYIYISMHIYICISTYIYTHLPSQHNIKVSIIYNIHDVGKTINHPPVITIFIGGILYHSQMGGLWLCFSHIMYIIDAHTHIHI